MKKILLDGYFDRNFGDDMMIRIMAHELPEFLFYMQWHDEQMFVPFRGDKNIRYINYDLRTLKAMKFDGYVRIIGAGFLVRNTWAFLYSLAYFLRDCFRVRYPEPRAVIGCCIEDFCNRAAELIQRARLREYDLISCRDEYSYRYIKGAINKHTTLRRIPDIVFSLPNDWIEKCSAHAEKKYFGISLANGRSENYCEKIVSLCEQIIDKYNSEVILFAFDCGIENDKVLAERIYELCPKKDKIKIISHTDDGSSIIRGFSMCRAVVATRFHAAVLAMRMGIPFVPICYGRKLRNVLLDSGWSGGIHEVSSFNPTLIAEELTKAEVFKYPEYYNNSAAVNAELFRALVGNKGVD